ncbi:apolipoprotein acyltransferase [Escherichia coli]|uniref:apolipoprotein acyltransferase n=1 Tax=Escherichia coli TaxID=562 RepID=UPI00191A244F|nr:apolipoprotein acyltransferase [Escherichia coli]
MRIAVIQTGLYFEIGGNTESFPLDLVKFLEENRNVDLVVFSENSLYGNKTEYNRIQTDKLMSVLNENKMFDKHAFIFNFYGYKDINNIVSVFKFKDIEIINQKEALIPYIEKKSFFSYDNLFNSEYFYVSPSMKKQIINYNGHKISTFICFDSLFPSLFSRSDLVIVQSNYNRLNKGVGYEQILRNGGVLGWFSNAMNSDLYINVQDTGGSIIIRNNDGIDDEIFSHSLTTPFIIISR